MPQLTWLDRAVLSTLSRLLPARFARCYLWVPRTVPPPLISTFPKVDLNITVPGRPSMIARCGPFGSPT